MALRVRTGLLRAGVPESPCGQPLCNLEQGAACSLWVHVPSPHTHLTSHWVGQENGMSAPTGFSPSRVPASGEPPARLLQQPGAGGLDGFVLQVEGEDVLSPLEERPRCGQMCRAPISGVSCGEASLGVCTEPWYEPGSSFETLGPPLPFSEPQTHL